MAHEIPAARRRGGGDGGGFPADRASPSRVREREEGGEGGRRLGFKGAAPQPSPSPYIGVRGLWGASQTHLGPAKGGNLPPQGAQLGLGLPPPCLGRMSLGDKVRPAHVGCCTSPRSMWELLGSCPPKVGPFGTFRNLLESSGTLPEFPKLFRNPGNHFPYMKLYLRTRPELLVMSRISSETPNQYSFIPSNYLIVNPSYIGALSV